MNLNTVVLPNLILSDLMLTQAMSSYNGSVVFLDYCAGTSKGGVERGDQFNGVFSLGEMTEERRNWTSQAVTETVDGADGTKTEFALMWTPIASLKAVTVNGTAQKVDGSNPDVTISTDKKSIVFGSAPAAGAVIKVAYLYDNEFIPANDIPTLNLKMRRIPLQAKARRIAVFYSNLAA